GARCACRRRPWRTLRTCPAWRTPPATRRCTAPTRPSWPASGSAMLRAIHRQPGERAGSSISEHRFRYDEHVARLERNVCSEVALVDHVLELDLDLARLAVFRADDF